MTALRRDFGCCYSCSVFRFVTAILPLLMLLATDVKGGDARQSLSSPPPSSTSSPSVTWHASRWSPCRPSADLSAELGCSRTLSIRTRAVQCVQKRHLQQLSTQWSSSSSSFSSSTSPVRAGRVLSDGTCAQLSGSRPANWSLCNGPCYRAAPSAYRWVQREWSKCDYLCHTNASLARSSQTRSVTCQHVPSGAVVVNDFCRLLARLPKPRMWRECRFQDADCVDGREPRCAYDYWSRWSACSVTCGTRRCRTRTRLPVTFPRDGQRVCTDTMQLEPCPLTWENARPVPRLEYVLKASAWEPCQLDRSADASASVRREDATIYQTPLLGERRRRTACVRVPDGREMSHTYCNNWSVSAAAADDGHVRSLCVVPQNCSVTEWTGWTPSSEQEHQLCVLRQNRVELVWPARATMTRSRRIKMQRFGSGRQCPELEETRPVSLSLAHAMRLETCNRLYQWFAGDWMECVVRQDGRADHIHCGEGDQRRTVFCKRYNDSSNTPVQADLCTAGYARNGDGDDVRLQNPASIQPCHKRCVANCRVTEWSAWSECEQAECAGSTRPVAGGRQTRSRVVVTEPDDDGKPCSHLAETRDCGYKECNHYVVQQAEPCGVTAGEVPPSGKWGCVYLARWGEKPRPCKCFKRCQSWRDVRQREFRRYHICEPVGARNSTTYHQVKYRARSSFRQKSCPTEFDTRPCQQPNITSLPVYGWHAESFPLTCREEHRKLQLPTTAREGRPPSCKVCNMGRKNRAVDCVRIDPITGEKRKDPEDERKLAIVGDRKCPPKDLYQPHTEETCHICCPESCGYSSWATWSSCQAEICSRQRFIVNCTKHVTCAASVAGHRKRTRFLLAPTTKTSCHEPGLKQHCTLERSLCYEWRTGNWSKCNYAAQLPCLGGFRTRTVFCRGSDGKPVTADLCAHLERPPLVELCNRHCNRICPFTPWSGWSRCSESSCGTGHRSRIRQLLVSTAIDGALSVLAKPCGDLMQTELCSVRPCRVYRVKYSMWGSWSPQTGSNGKCRHMERHRIGKCFDRKNRRRVPLDYCPREMRLKPTVKRYTAGSPPCSSGCQVTEWQTWTSTCDKRCGHGWLYRTRYSLRSRTSDGRPCPGDMLQRKPCFRRPCMPEVTSGNATRTFTWHADPWEPCRMKGNTILDNNNMEQAPCYGESTQRRRVMCLEILPSEESKIVPDNHCYKAKLRRQKLEQACRVVCPGDCEWGTWGLWSSCGGGFKQRHRRVRTPSSPLGVPCAESDAHGEKECVQKTSRTHRVSVGSWSGCQRLHHEPCGPAEDRRLVVCFDNRGRLASNSSECPKLATMETVRPCRLPCDRDCQLTEWSGWLGCSEKCDVAKDEKRTRRILQAESGTGTKCPLEEQLTEVRDCHRSKPCYRSKIYPWSQCLIDGADCGTGRRFRKITCRRSDNKLVSPLKCFANEIGPNQQLDTNLMVMTETDPCRKACPDECRYTPWSAWSFSCVANCNSRMNDSRTYKGRRIAFRTLLSAPDIDGSSCTEKLWISRQCKETFCMTFEWQAGDWKDNVRPVWCQRSDTVKVTDEACRSKARPKNTRCLPPCAADEACVNTTCHPVIGRGKLCVGDGCKADAHGRHRRSEALDSHQDTRTPWYLVSNTLWIAGVLTGTITVTTLATAVLVTRCHHSEFSVS